MSGNGLPELCFTDSNLWLYTFIAHQDPVKAAKAREIIETDDICLSSQVVNEVCANLVRKAAYDETRVRQVIERFYYAYSVIDLSEKIILSASLLRLKNKFAFWDGLIVAAALAAEATILYSEDMHDGLVIENKLKIVNPF